MEVCPSDFQGFLLKLGIQMDYIYVAWTENIEDLLQGIFGYFPRNKS